jgi:exopolysaccharide biosynthesis polyprenyl glycosylphosphotransferase
MIFSPLPRKRPRIQLRISERRLLLMAGDAIMIVIAVLTALLIWSLVGKRAFDPTFMLSQSWWFFVLSVLWFLLASANDYYELALAADRMRSIQRLISITLQMIVVYVLVFFFSERDALPRLFIIYYGVTSFVLVALWRLLNPALVGWASRPRRALVVGTDWAAQTIIDVMQREAANAYEVVGVIGAADEIGQMLNQVRIIGDGTSLMDCAVREQVSELIITSTRELPGDLFQGVMDAYEAGIVITPMPLLYERLTERVPVEHVGSNWAVVLPIGEQSVFDPYPIVKRVFDVLLSLIGTLLLVLLLPWIAAAIMIDSRGSVFFQQDRVGTNGRVFRILKFRTMIPDAEKHTGAVFAQVNDARITRVGRFLRRTRLDEAPQVLNILKGDMSMIGPRPERPEHVARLQQSIPFYRTRHVVAPGLTGWAQVRYRYGASDEDALVKLQYDLFYIRHQSVLLDLNILIRTVGKVLKMAGQ